MSKVAVASTDGISVDEHFGRSKEFLIYEVKKGELLNFLNVGMLMTVKINHMILRSKLQLSYWRIWKSCWQSKLVLGQRKNCGEKGELPCQ